MRCWWRGELGGCSEHGLEGAAGRVEIRYGWMLGAWWGEWWGGEEYGLIAAGRVRRLAC